MDILRLYICLSKEEKNQLMYLLKKERGGLANSMTLEDWAEKAGLSVRLYNILRKFWYYNPNILVCEITEREFFSIRGAGQRSWEEFEMLKGKII